MLEGTQFSPQHTVYARKPRRKPFPLTPGTFWKPVCFFLVSSQQSFSFLWTKSFVTPHCSRAATVVQTFFCLLSSPFLFFVLFSPFIPRPNVILVNTSMELFKVDLFDIFQERTKFNNNSWKLRWNSKESQNQQIRKLKLDREPCLPSQIKNFFHNLDSLMFCVVLLTQSSTSQKIWIYHFLKCVS